MKNYFRNQNIENLEDLEILINNNNLDMEFVREKNFC